MPTLYSNVTTGPAVEPISLTNAKSHLRVDHTDDDTLITLFIQVARETIEQKTNRSLITQVRRMKMDFFPMENLFILLPYGPVTEVTSIYYYNTSEVDTLLATSLYWTDMTSGIPSITIKDSWPSTYDMPNAVTIVYKAGYGASGSAVPSPLISAMYLLIGHLYENRQEVGPLQYATPFGVDNLVSSYVLEHTIKY